MFDWETATYGKIYDDIDLFKDFEADFSAIVHNDLLASDPELSSEPTIVNTENPTLMDMAYDCLDVIQFFNFLYF
uniref:Uncharacterized protein n=1 Tax=Tanacetum cinerariifolium TaxID=118510 RepID=A0A6L2MQ95_TANCI|nr:hypothetical protein [Tanacetum cinerariifolium]